MKAQIQINIGYVKFSDISTKLALLERYYISSILYKSAALIAGSNRYIAPISGIIKITHNVFHHCVDYNLLYVTDIHSHP